MNKKADVPLRAELHQSHPCEFVRTDYTQSMNATKYPLSAHQINSCPQKLLCRAHTNVRRGEFWSSIPFLETISRVIN